MFKHLLGRRPQSICRLCLFFALTLVLPWDSSQAAPLGFNHFTYGAVFADPDPTDDIYPPDLFGVSQLSTTGPANVDWNFVCQTCVGFDLATSGRGTAGPGTLRVQSVLDFDRHGTPFHPSFVATSLTAAQSMDTLQIASADGSGGAGVMRIRFHLDGEFNSIGFGHEMSRAYIAVRSTNSYNNQVRVYAGDPFGSRRSNEFRFDGYNFANGVDTSVTFLIPFLFDSPPWELFVSLDAWAEFYERYNSSPYRAETNFSNTATIESVEFFRGTTTQLGELVTDASIFSAAGLIYGVDGVTEVPEPASLFLTALPLVWIARRIRATNP